MTDDEVSELEVRLAGEEAGVPGGLADDGRRRPADRELLEELAAAGFAGPVYEMFAAGLAAYGLAVTMAWLGTGEIVARCESAGDPVPGTDVSARSWSAAAWAGAAWTGGERLELATETVARALDLFLREVPAAGRWDRRRSPSMKAFFIGACVREFPGVFRAWKAGRRSGQPGGAGSGRTQ